MSFLLLVEQVTPDTPSDGQIVLYGKSDGRMYTRSDTGVELALQAFVEASTYMLFQQTAAPTGWTKVTSAAYHDAALRFTSSAVGTGGTTSFSSTFGLSKTTATDGSGTSGLGGAGSTGGFTLTNTEIPSHDHREYGRAANPGIVSISKDSDTGTQVSSESFTEATGGGGSHAHSVADHTHSTPNHNHALSYNDIKFVDCIVAQKD